MSLVAYGSSDESENEEETSQQPQIQVTSQEADLKHTKSKTVNTNSKLNLPNPKSEPVNNSTNTNGNDSSQQVAKLNFEALPKPVAADVATTVILDTDSVPVPKKIDYAQIEKPPKREKGPTKISIPSLSDFKDLDDETEEKSCKKAPSKKGSGLINVLPPPKTTTISTKANKMVPHVLTTKPLVTKKSIEPVNKTQKPPTKTKSTTSTFKSLSNYSDSDSEDDQKLSSGMDFFSLSTPIKIPDELLTPISKSEIDAINAMASKKKVFETDDTIVTTMDEMQEESKTKLVSNVMNLPREEILLKNKAEVGPKLPVPEQEYNVDSQGNVAFDEKAIEYLCGKRGVKRKNEFSNVDIVEINGEDIKPDEREWLVKALTEEKSSRPISAGAGPSGQSKKKHQITYLAHQAKAMELELKNQWAQNKATRQQTRSKYGF